MNATQAAMSMQAVGLAKGRSMGGVGGTDSSAWGGGVIADPFAAVFQNMIDMQAVPADGELLEGEEQELLSAYAAMMLGSTPVSDISVLSEDLQNALTEISAISQQTGSINLEELVTLLQKPIDSAVAQQNPLAQGVQNGQNTTEKNTGEFALNFSPEGLADIKATFSKVSPTATNFGSEQMFSDAVSKAKELLKSVDSEGETEIIPQTLNLNTLKLESTVPKGQVFETDITSQIMSGLEEGINEGKSEFTVKLKPESLGEITIKLVETAGKMTVRITAASEATVKLLNSNMAHLQDTMKPLQVEVREAVIETSSGQQAGLEFGMSNGGQFANRQAFSGERPYYAASEEIVAEVEVAPQSAVLDDGLNMYI